jgi:hypothetical protein
MKNRIFMGLVLCVWGLLLAGCDIFADDPTYHYVFDNKSSYSIHVTVYFDGGYDEFRINAAGRHEADYYAHATIVTHSNGANVHMSGAGGDYVFVNNE